MGFINTISGKKLVKLGLQVSTYIINEELSSTDTRTLTQLFKQVQLNCIIPLVNWFEFLGVERRGWVVFCGSFVCLLRFFWLIGWFLFCFYIYTCRCSRGDNFFHLGTSGNI